MSGNQYIYVVEVDERLRSNVQLVTKNRKEAIGQHITRTQRLYGQGFTLMDQFEILPGKMYQYVRPGSRDVCVRMSRYRKQDVDIVVRITAWVIKWAKEEAPRVIMGQATITMQPGFGQMK